MTSVQYPMSIVAMLTALAAAGCGSGARLDHAAQPSPLTTAALGSTSAVEGRAVASAPQRRAETVKVGVMLPLSGPGQAGLIAETMKKAAELALADARMPHVTLVVRDDKATPEGAQAAMRELVADKVEVVLGPLFSRSVQAAAPAARQANIPMLAFSNDRQVAGQSVTLLSFLAEPEVQRVVAHAAGKGRKRHAALISADSYGQLVEAAYRAAAARHGVQIVAVETYKPDSAQTVAEGVRNFRDVLRGLEEHGDPVDALFLPAGEETLALLTPQLKASGIDTQRIKVLGTGAMDFPTAGRDGVLAGAWFAAPDPKGWTAFAARYAQQHGHAPPRIAALAHDAMVLATSLSNGPDGARYLPSELTRASGFEGIDGTFRIGIDGTVERPLAILEVKTDGATIVAAAEALPRTATPPSVAGSAGKLGAAGGFLSSIPSAFPPVN